MPQIVDGDEDNFKITTSEDLAAAGAARRPPRRRAGRPGVDVVHPVLPPGDHPLGLRGSKSRTA